MSFRTALLHESPGTDFESAVERNLIRRPLRILATASSRIRNYLAQPKASEPRSVAVETFPSDCWRFASVWRGKPTDNFAPASGRKKFFRCLTTTVTSLALLLAVGCKTETKHASNADFSSTSKAVSLDSADLQMLTVTNELDPLLLHAPTNLFTLGPGDKLEIEMVDETNSASVTVVGPDGKVYFSLLSGIDVWGLTLGQARENIEHDLAQYVRGQPQVNVTLRDVQSKHVWLLGRFQAPGIYNMAAPTTLLEAIASAGGSQSFAGQRQISEGGPLGEDLADLQHSFIVRDNKMLPVDFHALLDKGDLSQNIYLLPDDFVYFAPSYAKEVYVLGAVLQPKPVQYVRGMSLMQAIAGAYGTVQNAWLAHVTIVRGSISHPQVAFVNYYDVVKGKAPDVALQPGDIVYVPLTRYRYLRKYLDVALNTFASSVAINAGTQLSAGRNGGVSGITIPAGSGITIVPNPAPPVGSH